MAPTVAFIYLFIDNSIVHEEGGFETWMSLLETPGGAKKLSYKLLANGTGNVVGQIFYSFKPTLGSAIAWPPMMSLVRVLGLPDTQFL